MDNSYRRMTLPTITEKNEGGNMVEINTREKCSKKKSA